MPRFWTVPMGPHDTFTPGSSGGSGTVATFTAVDRDTVGTAGNVLLTLTVSGISDTPAVAINGVACTSVTVVNSTTVTCRTPALSASTWLSPYAMTCGGHTLANAINVLPSFTTAFGQSTFESGLLSPFTGDTGSAGTVTVDGTTSHLGTHSAFCNVPTGASGIAQVLFTFPGNNPFQVATNPNGVFSRWYFMTDATTLSAISTGGGQMKLHLTRPANGSGGYLMLVMGAASGMAGTSNIAVVLDQGTVNLHVPTPFTVTAGVWTEVVVCNIRNNDGTGDSTVWVNGKVYYDSRNDPGDVNLSRASIGLDTAVPYYTASGIPFTNTNGANIKQWVDDCVVANGWIDPP